MELTSFHLAILSFLAPTILQLFTCGMQVPWHKNSNSMNQTSQSDYDDIIVLHVTYRYKIKPRNSSKHVSIRGRSAVAYCVEASVPDDES